MLYLDLDDTLLSWAEGYPQAAPGARDFVVWALRHCEVRWLTTWCPGGRMPEDLLCDLCKMLRLEPGMLRRVRGCSWASTESKLNGIAWLEHRVLGRPWAWVEDEKGFGAGERDALEANGLLAHYLPCNVSRTPGALQRVHAQLRECFPASHTDAAA